MRPTCAGISPTSTSTASGASATRSLSSKRVFARSSGSPSAQRVAILGAGNLGRALANYGGLSRRGFDVVALYDTDVRKIGSKVGSITIQDLDLLDGDCTSKSFEIAILAVPAVAAQQVADRLVEHGIRSILNFAPVRVNVPEKVSVRQVDLSMELQVLSYYGSRL